MANGTISKQFRVETVNFGGVTVAAGATKWFTIPQFPGYTKLGIIGYQLNYGSLFNVYYMDTGSLAIRNMSSNAETSQDIIVKVLLEKE